MKRIAEIHSRYSDVTFKRAIGYNLILIMARRLTDEEDRFHITEIITGLALMDEGGIKCLTELLQSEEIITAEEEKEGSGLQS